jgi:hypothetical protein
LPRMVWVRIRSMSEWLAWAWTSRRRWWRVWWCRSPDDDVVCPTGGAGCECRTNDGLAAMLGHLACLRYAHECGAPWGRMTCEWAARNGHLDCLRYAHEHGAPWDAMTCDWAARNGHLACLRYAHEHGAPWGRDTCTCAAINGHLACMRYAHEHGAPLDEWTCAWAGGLGHLACLRYAVICGAPRTEAPAAHFLKARLVAVAGALREARRRRLTARALWALRRWRGPAASEGREEQEELLALDEHARHTLQRLVLAHGFCLFPGESEG